MNTAKTTVTIALEIGGTRRIKISAPNAEARDRALRRLARCTPSLELLEEELQKAIEEEARS
jgi:hypothetical protein